jgi:hypothetical protein
LAFALRGRAGANDRIRAAIIGLGWRGGDPMDRLGRKLTFNPATERFTANAEADLMLKCEHRSPYALPGKV